MFLLFYVKMVGLKDFLESELLAIRHGELLR